VNDDAEPSATAAIISAPTWDQVCPVCSLPFNSTDELGHHLASSPDVGHDLFRQEHLEAAQNIQVKPVNPPPSAATPAPTPIPPPPAVIRLSPVAQLVQNKGGPEFIHSFQPGLAPQNAAATPDPRTTPQPAAQTDQSEVRTFLQPPTEAAIPHTGATATQEDTGASALVSSCHNGHTLVATLTPTTGPLYVYGARFSTEMYARGCHWIPRMFASSEHACNQWHSSRVFTPLTG
jgi:hypothetical protein